MVLFLCSKPSLLKWPLLMMIALQSCEVSPKVRVEPTGPPTFTFSSGTSVEMLLVYHLNAQQRDRGGLLLESLLADKANINWMIEGENQQQLPITYGTVPVGMKETIEAKPLLEGEYYFVFVGSLVGARFFIKDGIAQPIRQSK